MSAIELWTMMPCLPGTYAEHARRAEDEGWDGIGVPDSQSNLGDPYATLAVAANVTTRLKLATNVTNPYTRHPAIAAAAIASVHGESGGRAMLGIGRGDSALAHIGFAPVRVSTFVEFVRAAQGYLRGDDVPFRPDGSGTVKAVAELGIGSPPTASRLRWIDSLGLSKVPIDVAANGPRVITALAPLVEAMTFASGAEPTRIQWAIDTARSARADAGVDPDGMSFGLRVPLAVAETRREAIDVLRPRVASYARFSVLHGTVAGPIDDSLRTTLEHVRASYDMVDHHGAHVDATTDELVDAYAIGGPPAYCAERILELHELGIERFVVGHLGIGAASSNSEASRRRFVEEVAPAVRLAI